MNHELFQAKLTRIEQQLDGGRLKEAFDGAQQLLQRARVVGEKAYPGADYDLAMACFTLARVLKTASGPEQALPLLDEARKRFETIATECASRATERMVSVCLSDRADCLRILGRLDEAVAAYKENIRRADKLSDDRQVAVGKNNLGIVFMHQGRYEEALQAFEETRKQFTRLKNPGYVGESWHQTGRVYQEARQAEAAEDAFRKSLAIKVRLGDIAGQARTLNALGKLYDDLGRTEEAAAFLSQAVDKYVDLGDPASEGIERSNLAIRLRKLHRFDNARREIYRAIECKEQFGHAAEPWKTWDILTDIEIDTGNPAAAAEAKRKATACYLAYRRDGGENHYPDGRICLAVTQQLLAGYPTAAASLLQQLAADPKLPARLRPLLKALQAIVAGSRNRTLADAPDMYYRNAAEILFLIETLERHQRP